MDQVLLMWSSPSTMETTKNNSAKTAAATRRSLIQTYIIIIQAVAIKMDGAENFVW
jgi:hypothetical protein